MKNIITKIDEFLKKENNSFDINKDIEESTDIEYLKELEKCIDIDISNIGKDSEIIRKMKAKMRNTTPDEYDEKQRKGFANLKKKVQDRIKELESK